MTLKDLYEIMATGELSQVIFGSTLAGDQDIPAARRTQIRHSVQMGLTSLHKRFYIREATETVPVVSGTLSYTLAATDLIKVLGVKDAAGVSLPLNELGNADSLRTISDKVIVIPSTLDTASMVVTYQANHPELNKYLADSAPTAVDVDLPLVYLEALCFYVASRALNPVGIANEFHDGNNYAMKYEKACQELETYGMDIEGVTENTRLEANYWP